KRDKGDRNSGSIRPLRATLVSHRETATDTDSGCSHPPQSPQRQSSSLRIALSSRLEATKTLRLPSDALRRCNRQLPRLSHPPREPHQTDETLRGSGASASRNSGNTSAILQVDVDPPRTPASDSLANSY